MSNVAVASSPAELAKLSELIDSIYQTATEPQHWNRVLSQIAAWVDAPKGLLFTPLVAPSNGGYYFVHNLPDALMQLWATKYEKEDTVAIRSIERGFAYEGNVFMADEVLPHDEYLQSVLYRELNSKYDIEHRLFGIIFGLGTPGNQQTPWAVCSFYRGLNEGPFAEEQRSKLKLLVPHLSRALGVMSRLRDAELKAAASLASLEYLSTGVLLFRADGIVLFANRTARRIMEAEDGLGMQLRHNDSALGTVIADDSATHNQLIAAIRNAVAPDPMHTEHFSHAVVVPRPSGQQPYTINLSSLAPQNEFGCGPEMPRAIAFITDSAEPVRLDAGLLKRTYALTPAEIRVAELMAECLTVNETAEKLNLSSSTVKAQLQSIYDKTNTNNRARLMKLLMSLARLDC